MYGAPFGCSGYLGVYKFFAINTGRIYFAVFRPDNATQSEAWLLVGYNTVDVGEIGYQVNLRLEYLNALNNTSK